MSNIINKFIKLNDMSKELNDIISEVAKEYFKQPDSTFDGDIILAKKEIIKIAETYNSELKEQLTAKENTIQNQGENIIKWMNDCHIKMAENQDLIDKLAAKEKELKIALGNVSKLESMIESALNKTK